MLRFARFSQFDDAQFWIVPFIATAFFWKSHDTFYNLTQDSSYVLSASSADFGKLFAYFWFWVPGKKQTKILRKLWCARLQIEVAGVKGDKGTLTYPPAFFLHLVFENYSQIFIEYITVTFEFYPCALLPTEYRKCAKMILFGACSNIDEVIAE